MIQTQTTSVPEFKLWFSRMDYRMDGDWLVSFNWDDATGINITSQIKLEIPQGSIDARTETEGYSTFL